MKLQRLIAALACLIATPIGAQQSRPLLAAAERLNSVTPQAVARQTIRLGTYDAATKTFAWALEAAYPPNTADYKTAEQSGPAQLRYYADVNSYTLTYEILIANKPANFSLAIVYPGPSGQVITKPASIAGNLARIEISPPATSPHEIRVNQSGAPSLRFHPRLANQLGAFVVPYLLVSIIYEPPGTASRASYEVTTTAGTSMTFGFSRTSGFMTEAAPTDTLMWAFNMVVPAYLEHGLGVPGWITSVLKEIGGIQSNTVQLIIDTTVSNSRTKGHVFSITEGWETRANDAFAYPGNGDVYVILQDVLFMYVAYQGKIYLTPVAYSIDRGLISSELPSDLASAYMALNPHFHANARGPITRGGTGVISPVRNGTLKGTLGGPNGDAGRLRRLPNQPCEQNATKILEIVSTDYQITSATRAVTQTKLERATGLVAIATGTSGTTTTSVTYSSTTENYSATSTAPRIEVACEGESFEIEVFFDNLFGTFFTRRGPALATYAAMSGQATDAQGRPRPNQLVTLTIGDRSYRVRSDANGNFRFPFATIPVGSGTLRVGEQAAAVKYTGVPTRITVKGNVASEATTAAQPLPKPANRPRRP